MNTTFQDYLTKYKTTIIGLVGAVVLAIIQIDATNGAQWKDFILPVVLAVTGFVGTQVRGQWSTIVGIVGVLIYNIVKARVDGTHYTFTPQDFQSLVMQLAVLYGFVAMPPIKPRSYEHDPVIQDAKQPTETPVVPLNNPNQGA